MTTTVFYDHEKLSTDSNNLEGSQENPQQQQKPPSQCIEQELCAEPCEEYHDDLELCTRCKLKLQQAQNQRFQEGSFHKCPGFLLGLENLNSNPPLGEKQPGIQRDKDPIQLFWTILILALLLGLILVSSFSQ